MHPASTGADTYAARGEFDKIQALLSRGDAALALALLRSHVPASRPERVEAERLSAQACYMLGDQRAALEHLVRALRSTRGLAAERIRVHANLADVLLRLGDRTRAERHARRAIAEIQLHGVARSQHPWLLSTLALIQRRRGMLAAATRTYEQAIAVADATSSAPSVRAAIANNLALVLHHRGETSRARSLLQEVQRPGPAPLPENYVVGLRLTEALLALHLEDLAACAQALAAARTLVGSSDLRAQFLLRGYEAELATLRGDLAAAVPALEALLHQALAQPTLRDLISGTARRLSTALLRELRAREALDRARLAIRWGRDGDVQEWAAGLRVAAEALAALGRHEEARGAIAEALSVLEAGESVAELERLESLRARLDLTHPEPHAEPAPKFATAAPARSSAEPVRIPLRDGRWFATHDEALVRAIRLASDALLPALIVGETGTGKELVAHLIHEMGRPPGSPLVIVDCATIPENLAEAELFGAARGAYSGAVADRSGLVAAAEGGTLFLDELPELSLPLQAKLLRLVQDGTYRRVGEQRARSVRFRIVTAMNQEPAALVSAGKLKPDLYYRLHGHHITIPPLRDRQDDLRWLARTLAKEAKLAGITDGAMDLLARHHWPGNVRELEMMIRVLAAAAGKGAWLDEPAFAHLRQSATDRDTSFGASAEHPLRERRARAEREFLQRILERHDGNIAAAARELSMTRQGLHKALRRNGLIL